MKMGQNFWVERPGASASLQWGNSHRSWTWALILLTLLGVTVGVFVYKMVPAFNSSIEPVAVVLSEQAASEEPVIRIHPDGAGTTGTMSIQEFLDACVEGSSIRSGDATDGVVLEDGKRWFCYDAEGE